MRRSVLTAALAVVLLFGTHAQTNSADSNLVDSKIAQHYGMAVSAFRAGDYSKVLAETNLILLDTPIRVHANLNGLPERRKSSYATALRNGLEMWNKALPSEKPLFVLVEQPADAQVTIRFEDAMSEGEQRICGHVFWRRRYNWDDRAKDYLITLTGEIRISKLEKPNGRWHDAASIQHITAHELGHILGLEDVPTRGAMMGPDVHGQPCPDFGKAELAAIKDLRARCLRLRGEALAKLKRWDDAEVAYRNALAIAPDDADTRTKLELTSKQKMREATKK